MYVRLLYTQLKLFKYNNLQSTSKMANRTRAKGCKQNRGEKMVQLALQGMLKEISRPHSPQIPQTPHTKKQRRNLYSYYLVCNDKQINNNKQEKNKLEEYQFIHAEQHNYHNQPCQDYSEEKKATEEDDDLICCVYEDDTEEAIWELGVIWKFWRDQKPAKQIILLKKMMVLIDAIKSDIENIKNEYENNLKMDVDKSECKIIF